MFALESLRLKINGEIRSVEADPQMPLLWVIRDYLGLTGTKFGCGISQCGACTIHLDGNPVRACMIPASVAEGKTILTIEGISKNNDHPVQRAWIEEQVPQCGYCQSGQIMQAVALLDKNPNPTEKEIATAMRNVLCRCGTYPRIRKAIAKAITLAKS